MNHADSPTAIDRRRFLQDAALLGGAVLGGAALATACAGNSASSAAAMSRSVAGESLSAWRDRIGLQLFTVRDKFPADFEGTLMAVSRIGYKEVQTTLTYGGHSLPEIKSYLDRAGLRASATHVSPQNGADFETILDSYAAAGHRYTTVNVGAAGGRGGGRGGAGAGAGAARAAGAGAASAPNLAGDLRGLQPPAPLQTLDAVKRTAQQLNDAGRITQKHGLKVIVHNHTTEFRALSDSSRQEYDVLVSETDPALVSMELDIGWAAVAGENALDLFKRYPGRFEVWHVKDIKGLAALRALPSMEERNRTAQVVPLGDGEIDYRPIFAAAGLAGMQYFYVEQDSAPQSGDSLGAAATSYRNLVTLLS